MGEAHTDPVAADPVHRDSVVPIEQATSQLEYLPGISGPANETGAVWMSQWRHGVPRVTAAMIFFEKNSKNPVDTMVKEP